MLRELELIEMPNTPAYLAEVGDFVLANGDWFAISKIIMRRGQIFIYFDNNKFVYEYDHDELIRDYAKAA